MKVLLTRSTEMGYELASADGHYLEISLTPYHSAEVPAIAAAVDDLLGIITYPLWEFAFHNEQVFLCEVDDSYWSRFEWIGLSEVPWIGSLGFEGVHLVNELMRVTAPTAVPFVPWLRPGWVRDLQVTLRKQFGADCLIQPHKLRCDTLVIRVATRNGEFYETRTEADYSASRSSALAHRMLQSMLGCQMADEWPHLNARLRKAPCAFGLGTEQDWKTAVTGYTRVQQWISEQFFELQTMVPRSSAGFEDKLRIPSLGEPTEDCDINAIAGAAAGVLTEQPMAIVSSNISMSPFDISIESDGLRISSWEHMEFTHPLEALTPFFAGIGAQARPPTSRIVGWWSDGRGQSEPRVTERDLNAALTLMATRRLAGLRERRGKLSLLGTALQVEITAWTEFAKIHGSRLQS